MGEHIREHRSLLAGVEKRLLIHIAHRLPTRVHSDHLTALALAAMATAGAAFAAARWDRRALWIVVAALAVNWFGDSLDGTVARVRRVERPRYGFYVDHVLDLVGITMLMAGLAVSGFMTPLIAASLLVAYLLVSGEVFLATAVRGVFKMASFGVGPTELRILLAIGAVALLGDPHVDLAGLGRWRLFDVGGVVAIAGMTVTLLTAAWTNGQALARLEPRRTVAEHSADVPGCPVPGSSFALFRVRSSWFRRRDVRANLELATANFATRNRNGGTRQPGTVNQATRNREPGNLEP